MSGRERKSRDNVEGTARKCKAVTMETKMKIIEQLQWGEKMVDLAHSYKMNRLTTVQF